MSMIYADQIVVGNVIIPPGRKRPVEVIGQLSDPGKGSWFEFMCWGRGRVALRLHRSEQVQLVGGRLDANPQPRSVGVDPPA